MLSGKLIYVIDDDRGFLRGMERVLSAYGLKVRTFASAEAFQAEADLGQAACLILDVQLGTVSGIDLLGRLSASGDETPVVLVTANDSEQLRRSALEARSCPFLQKPFSASVLMEAVSGATGLSLN